MINHRTELAVLLLLRLENGCLTCGEMPNKVKVARLIDISYASLCKILNGEKVTEATFERLELYIWNRLQEEQCRRSLRLSGL